MNPRRHEEGNVLGERKPRLAGEAATKSVVVFGSSRTAPEAPLYRTARQLGRALVERGALVKCGGYAGVMEALAAGVKEAGGTVIGCTIDWFTDSRTPNRYLDEELRSRDLPERIGHLLDGTHAAIALAGGIGTLNEVFWLWTLLLHGKGEKRRLILLGDPWPELLRLLSERFEVDSGIRDLVRLATTPDEAARLACGGERE